VIGPHPGGCPQNELALFLRRGLPGWLDWVIALVPRRSSMCQEAPWTASPVDQAPDRSPAWKDEMVSLLSTMILQTLEVPA